MITSEVVSLFNDVLFKETMDLTAPTVQQRHNQPPPPSAPINLFCFVASAQPTKG
jgi:hypothetical protein